MRKLTLILRFLPGIVPTLAFFGLWAERASSGVRSPEPYPFFLVWGVILLLIGVAARRAPVVGGAMFLTFGFLMLVFLGSLALAGGMDRTIFLAAAVPFGALIILAGALNMRLGFKLDEPGQGG